MNKIAIAIGLIFLVIAVSGCVNHLSNPAPRGGCFSKFAIINAKTEPHIPCLKFSGNNCNDLSLYVTSFCEEPVYINGTEIPYEECNIIGGSYWITRNNGAYEIIPESELSSLYLFNLPKEEFLSKFGDSCIKEYEKIPFEIKLGEKKYSIQFSGNEYTKHGPEYKGVTTHTVIGSPGNCLDYTLRNFYNANCKLMQISTRCEESIELINQVIEPDKNCKINNSYLLLDTGDSNLFYKGVKYYQGKQIPPPENTDFFVDGEIGGKKFKISFTVTKKLRD